MSRQQLIDMAKRNLAHVKAGTVDRAPGIHEVPARNYYDRDHIEALNQRVISARW